MKNVDLMLKISNHMTYESRDEKKCALCREKDREKRDEREEGKAPM